MLLFTSELAEIPLVCDRVVCLYGGRVTAELDAAGADEATLLKAMHGLEAARRRVSPSLSRSDAQVHWGRLARRHAWTAGVYVLLLGLILYWRTIPAQWGTFDVQSLAIDALPFAFVAMAQAVVIISGGIDLSVGSMMSLVNVLSAKYMFDATSGQAVSFRESIVIAVVLVLGAGAGRRTDRPDHHGHPGRGHHRHARDALRLGRRWRSP